MKHAMLLLLALWIGAVAVAQSGSVPAAGTTQNNSTTAQAEQITNGPVAEIVADSSATLGWSARSAGNMSVKYGAERDHLDQTATATPSADGRNYHARLQGLTPGTRYYFQVMLDGQPVGGIGTFHTTAPGDAPIKSKAIIPQ